MRVRLLAGIGAGRILTVPPDMAAKLLEIGVAEVVPEAPETTMIRPAEMAVLPQPRGR